MKAYIYHSAAHRPVGLCNSSSRDSVNHYVRTAPAIRNFLPWLDCVELKFFHSNRQNSKVVAIVLQNRLSLHLMVGTDC
jgi:hypothetical protein